MGETKGAAGRKRASGRGIAAETGQLPEAPVVSLRPGQCRGYLRREAARAFPAVVGGFLEQAKAGSCQHLRFLTEMFEETRPKPRERVEKGPAEQMVEEWGLE